MSAESKITLARTGLILDNPFFGALAMHLKMKADPGCGTAWVDGHTLGYDPKFINSLSSEQVISLLAHEVMHCAMGHPWRRDGRTMRPWNIACDKAINESLKDAGFILPPNPYLPEGDEAGKSAEWIYGSMQQQESEQPEEQEQAEQESEDGEDGQGEGDGEEDGEGDSDGQGDGEGDSNGGNGAGDEPDPLGEVRDAPTGTDETGEPAPTEQDWKEHVASAATQAKLMGKMPASMDRVVEQALKAKLDVRSLLLRFFSERATGDFTWTRPSPRYIARGLYLPTLETKSLGEVAVMVDTSGSISGVELNKARGILESVIEECSPTAVTVYYADADVCRIDRFEQGEPLVWQPTGGGGTDFRPSLQAIEDAGTAVCAVCITDLYGSFPNVPPSYPVLWISTTENLQAPFGETVYYDGV